MTALLRACLALVFLATAIALSAQAQAASFGRETVGTLTSAGLRADFKRGSKFVLSERATLQSLCAYLDSNGGGTGVQWLRYALYRDRNGAPAEQITETGLVGFEAGHQPANWYCHPAAQAPLEAGVYWIVIHSGGDPGIVRYYHDGPANWYGNMDTFADGGADTFGAGSAGQGTLSLRVDYLTESEIRFAGQRTVGTRVSAPMSADFKRGSSFEITEPADVQAFNVYIDGLGGTSGAQHLLVALYTADANGEPSALVARTHIDLPVSPAGRTARWMTGYTRAVTLMPGRYWFVLHTGSPSGVLRYYLAEGPGNWRGNANPGEEPSAFFGTATRGDGTMTAHILYKPSTAVFQTFGQTTPGTLTSRGLTADFIRGSTSLPNPSLLEGTVTALWAYLDGNGGASGSQKVRLALYRVSQDNDLILLKTMSEEVTIAAGTPPGWVRFAVPYTPIFPEPHAIMILSGGTGGVVRNYATYEVRNWVGTAASYAQGAPTSIWLTDPETGISLPRGDVTLSVYGEYLDTSHIP
jgi:hypothetical protein